LPVSRKGKIHKKVTATPEIPLAHSLAREPPIDPELARLIDAWPTLPGAIRMGILGMIEAAKPEIVNRPDNCAE
jgi:hypothetical protein